MLISVYVCGCVVFVLSFDGVIAFPLTPPLSLQEDASVYVAEEAEAKASVCALSHPVRNARIQNWNDLELLWWVFLGFHFHFCAWDDIC